MRIGKFIEEPGFGWGRLSACSRLLAGVEGSCLEAKWQAKPPAPPRGFKRMQSLVGQAFSLQRLFAGVEGSCLEAKWQAKPPAPPRGFERMQSLVGQAFSLPGSFLHSLLPGTGPKGAAAGVAFILSACILAGCGGPALPVLGQIPAFQLTAQDGQPFNSRALAGKIWVVDFFFTTCPGPCPLMNERMHQIQTKTDDLSDVRLVSFTVDPAHDTPPVLAAYAKHFLAQAGRWFFLTGPQDRLNNLGLNAFHLNRVDGSLNHSTRFTLVDRRGRIRGYYRFSDDNFPKQLLADVRQLEREHS